MLNGSFQVPVTMFLMGGIIKLLNNNSKAYIACGLALCAVGGYAGYSVVEAYQQPVSVVVATQNIEPHTQVTGAMVKTIDIPAGGRSEAAVDDPSLVVGGYTTSKVYAGQQLIQPMVQKQYDATGASGLALSIPDEALRAISFPADATSTVNGNIQKGDFVDIIADMSGSSLGADESITKTILQSVEVIDISKAADGGGVQNITLLLTLEQAEVVKHAYKLGAVTYALNPGNSRTSRTAGVTNQNFMERFGYHVVKK